MGTTISMVILFSIDGMRPDALQQARTPNIDEFIANGASTMTARTVMPSITLPCHTSMLRGVDVARHGITSNLFTPLARPVPSLFDVASAAGLKCGSFINWGQLRDLHEPESVQYLHYVNDFYSPEGDWKVADAAVRHIGGLDFAFVYFGWTDQSGHQFGWMSDEQIAAIENADACVGAVLASVSDPTVILQSDHGGHERSHGTEMLEDMTIPWIASGPGIRKGHSIQSEVRTFDTCVTLGHLLGLTPAREWEGSVVEEALAD